MDLKIDYAGLTDDDLRTVVAEATVELDKRRTLTEAPARIAALYQRIEDAGGDTKQAEVAVTAERAVLATEAARALMGKTESVEIKKEEERHEAGPTTEDS